MKRVSATVVVVEKQWLLHIVSVCVAVGTQHAMRMSHIVVCGLSGYTVFFHVIP